ncbi:hypothetical protein JTB14_013320 [Gonioctena quinquepunctata]|nr:hypothetical protein JTB14_013320 [Gonioctena quinquepunctata]
METQRKKRLWFSYFAATSVNFMTFVAGTGFAWSSPCVPKLTGAVDPAFNPLPHPATIHEISWITSLHNLGSLCGPLFTGYIASRLGKKRTLIMFSIPQVVSNVILIFANDVIHFYVSRFLLGMSTGCVFSIIPSYVAEITEPAHRGRTSMVSSLMVVSAQLFIWVVGPFVTIRTLAMLCLLPSALFLLIFGIYVPESPHYYVMHKQLEKAEEALIKSGADNVQNELKEIVGAVENSKTTFSFEEFRRSKAAKKSFVMSIALMFFQQFNGHPSIAAYQQTIFDSTKSESGGEKSVMIAGVVQLLSTLLTVKLVDRVGRKKLLVCSYSGLLASLSFLGVYFYLEGKKVNMDSFSWLPIVCVLLNVSSFKMGSGPISWTIVGEILPPNLRYYLNGTAAFAMTLFGFLCTLLFPIISSHLGMCWTLWTFSGIIVCALLFVIYIIPETKGKSLQEIQGMLNE